MGLFTKKIGTVFVKDTSDADIFLQKMELLREKAVGSGKDEIDKQIKMAAYGKAGEDNIAFELKNSGIDMYVLRDIYLEINDLSAQIDYIVITRKYVYIIECKNLIGNIEINNAGDFIRTYELFGKRVREGIYSPITQNQRHLRVLKEVRRTAQKGILGNLLFEKNFDSAYKSIIVLANPKTYLNAKYAKKEIKNQVIRADQLIEYIKRNDANSQEASFSSEQMLKLAQFFLEKNQTGKSDYVKKYEQMLENVTLSDVRKTEQNKVPSKTVDKVQENSEVIISKLKAFRLEQSRKEKIKPYYIFNDNQMMSLLEYMPGNIQELMKVSGFGKVKAEKYGKEILNILNQK